MSVTGALQLATSSGLHTTAWMEPVSLPGMRKPFGTMSVYGSGSAPGGARATSLGHRKGVASARGVEAFTLSRYDWMPTMAEIDPFPFGSPVNREIHISVDPSSRGVGTRKAGLVMLIDPT